MQTPLAITIGKALRKARESSGLTQEDAADRAGISAEFYARMERGRTLPSVPTLVRLAEALGVSADELLGRPAERRAGAAAVATPARGVEDESPEVRRLVRRLRRARPKALRLVGLLLGELETPGPAPPRTPGRRKG